MTDPVLLLDLFVPGVPRPKGSLAPQRVRAGDGRETGRVRLVDSDLSKAWRRKMAHAAEERKLSMDAWRGPVVVTARFGFAPCCKEEIHDEPHIGDLDKLLRNVYDALQDAKVYLNDRQVVRDGGSVKIWSSVQWQGARITVWGE